MAIRYEPARPAGLQKMKEKVCQERPGTKAHEGQIQPDRPLPPGTRIYRARSDQHTLLRLYELIWKRTVAQDHMESAR